MSLFVDDYEGRGHGLTAALRKAYIGLTVFGDVYCRVRWLPHNAHLCPAACLPEMIGLLCNGYTVGHAYMQKHMRVREP
jgi:hypothetical protein